MGDSSAAHRDSIRPGPAAPSLAVTDRAAGRWSPRARRHARAAPV